MEEGRIFKQDEMAQELMNMLRQNEHQEQANELYEAMAYVDGLEKKLDQVMGELLEMKKQLKDIQNQSMSKKVKDGLVGTVQKLEDNCIRIKKQLFEVKETIKEKATEIVQAVKEKGKAALARMSEFAGIKEKLEDIREKVRESIREIDATVEKIDAFGKGMREARQKIANTFRVLVDKEPVDYSNAGKKFSITDSYIKLFQIQRKSLVKMESRLDGAITKVDNLSKDVKVEQANKNLQDSMLYYDSFLAAKVAEPEMLYGADLFDVKCKLENKVNEVTLPSLGKTEGKSR